MWTLVLLGLIATAPIYPESQKVVSNVADPAGLQRIQSFCVETRNFPDDPDPLLPHTQPSVVRRFLLDESKPGGLLSDLPWKLLPNCTGGKPDAVLTISFVPEEPQVGFTQTEAGSGIPASSGWIRLTTTLLVHDAASRKVIYRVRSYLNGMVPSQEGLPTAIPLHGRAGLRDVFKFLIADLRQLSTGR